MQSFIDSLVPSLPDPRCSEVFAEGLPRNPRYVKRTINIFLFLWQLSIRRLPALIHPVRLAKVVTIQQNYPDLYAFLCEIPLLLRDLEIYFRFEDMKNNRAESDDNIRENKEEHPVTPLLPPQIQHFAEQQLLRRILTLHPQNIADVNFFDLNSQDIRPYIYLTRRAISTPNIPTEVLEPQLIYIPAGNFSIGSTTFAIEQPVHTLYLPQYAIGRYLITNYEYRAFVLDTGAKSPRHWEGNSYPDNLGDNPVVYISWHDAVAYCHWLSQKTGKPYRLPTEAEWEKAAKGTDERIWPWGNEWDTSKCNSADSRLNHTTPVGHFSPNGDSPYGIADMAGNVWEWCSSLYQPYPYRDDDRENMKVTGDRMLRGGCFSDENTLVRCSYRYKRLPESSDRNIGFRVVVTPV